jgi:hypothetical protein
MNERDLAGLHDDQPTDLGQEQAAWLQAVMRREIRLEVSGPEPHDPRIVDVDSRDLAMGC